MVSVLYSVDFKLYKTFLHSFENPAQGRIIPLPLRPVKLASENTIESNVFIET